MQERDIALNFIYLSPKHAGGKDQVGLNLLKGFQKIGFASRLYVICYDYSRDLVKSIAPDVEVISIKSTAVKGELKRMMQICFFNTFKLDKILLKNNIKLVYHLSCNTGLCKLHAKSVVIPHDIKAVAHRVLANVKIPFYKYIVYKIMYEVDFRTNDGIIAISDTDKGEISAYYPRYKDKVTRIYDPVDIEPDNSPRTRDGNYIVALNLQFHHKNIITLIKAFELIKDDITQDLVLVGNVPDRVKYLKEYVEEHHLGDRIRFTGFVSDEERDRLFKNCDLYVNPTLYEGFGMTAVEALIQRIPTLVSKIPTNYEITKGLAWYYEPAEDVDELARAMKKAIASEWTESDRKSQVIYDSYNYITIANEHKEYFESWIQ